MSSFKNESSGEIVNEIAAVIVANRAYLSEIDGKIGDGDHGVNMAKGFGRAAERAEGKNLTLAEALAALSDILMSEIGGSMGPLYGMMLSEMSEAIEDASDIDARLFSKLLNSGVEGVQDIGSAAVGDKTLLDTLIPAISAFDSALDSGDGFAAALVKMKDAAEKGRDSTIDMVAKIGRASRLGERSRGVLDPGATSCCLILSALADGVSKRLGN